MVTLANSIFSLFLHYLCYIINTNLLIVHSTIWLFTVKVRWLFPETAICMHVFFCLGSRDNVYSLVTQNWVCKSAVSAVPGSLWELQNLKPPSRPNGQKLYFNKILKWFMRTLTFEKCWLTFMYMLSSISLCMQQAFNKLVNKFRKLTQLMLLPDSLTAGI